MVYRSGKQTALRYLMPCHFDISTGAMHAEIRKAADIVFLVSSLDGVDD